MNVDMLLAHLGQYTANIDVLLQCDGGPMAYNLTIEEYPSVTPTEIRITGNGDTPKIQIEEIITTLESLTGGLPVVARIEEGPWGNVLAALEIPDDENATDVLLIALFEDIE